MVILIKYTKVIFLIPKIGQSWTVWFNSVTRKYNYIESFFLPFKILQMKKFIVILLFIACKSQKNEWVSLIKNNSLNGWHYFQDDGLKKGWSVENGILIFDKISGLESGEDDASLLSDKTYESFEIFLNGKLSKVGTVDLCGV